MGGPESVPPHNTPMTMAGLTPPLAQVLSSPGFWFGLALAAAVRLRRYREPI
jgi:hypothetical protein